MSPTAPGSFNFAWRCLGRQAAERGGKTALIIADGPDALRSWTYGELDALTRRLAGGFLASGLEKGDRVMIRAANGVEAVIAVFAAAAIGCVAQPASLMLTAEEALALAANSGAAAVVLGEADPSERALFSHLRVFDRADVAASPRRPPPPTMRRPRRTIRPTWCSPPDRPRSPRACCTGTGW